MASLKPDDPVSSSPGEALFQRRIEFHPARKPFSAIGKSGGDFHLETLNPTSSDSARSSGPTTAAAAAGSSGTPGKRSGFGELNERGWDPELSFEITFRRIGAGLRNLGNTCFLNSVLQCLTYTAPFAAYLQSGKHKSSCRTAGFCAMCAIQNHVMNALQSTGKIVTPLHLVKNLRCISRNFRNCRQEDAHEYMVNLLESMHKCCLPSGVPSESPSAYEKSLVHKIFGGRLRSQVKCTQCSYCSNKFDPFLDLSLEIVKADTLRKALSHFTAQEQLDGGERQYQCQRCKQKVRALKQLTIHKAPNILTIHLKRFSSDVPGQKINKIVEFGPALDLRTFVSDPQIYQEGDLGYTLYGVLVHAGYSTHSGHYYCFVRTSSGMWHSLDDNQVFQVSEKTVLEQKAYMLFYVHNRRGFPPKRVPDIVRKENIAANGSGNNVHVSSSDLKNIIQDHKIERIGTAAERYTCIPKTIISSHSKSVPAGGISSEVPIVNKVSTSLTDGHTAKETQQSVLLVDPKLDRSSEISSLKDPLPSRSHVLNTKGNPLVVDALMDSASCKSNGSQLVGEGWLQSSLSKDAGGEVNMTSSKGIHSDTNSHFEGSPVVSAQRSDGKGHLSNDCPMDRKEPVVQQITCNGLPEAAPEKSPIESGMHERGDVEGGRGQIGVTPCEVLKELEPDKINLMKLPNPSSVTDVLDAPRQTSVAFQVAVGKERGADDVLGEKVRESSVKETGLLDQNSKQSIANGCLQKGAMECSTDGSHRNDVKRKILPKLSLARSTLFGPRRLFFATLGLQKKKKHKKNMKLSLDTKRIRKKKAGGDSILGDQGTSTSETVRIVEVDATPSQKKRAHSSLNKGNGFHVAQDVNCGNDGPMCPKDRDVELRCIKYSAETKFSLAARQHETENMDASVKDSQRDFMSLLMRGLGEITVPGWDDVNVPPSQVHRLNDEPNGRIGYVLDEWDQEYDRGKRKKVKKSSNFFTGVNPFQEIAAIKTQQIMKKKMGQTSSGNLPFRIQ